MPLHRHSPAVLALGLWAAILLVMAPGAAKAQYSPDASASLGTGHGATALGGAVMGGTRAIGRPRQGTRQGLSPTMQRYCARWPSEGVCRAARARGEVVPSTPRAGAVKPGGR